MYEKSVFVFWVTLILYAVTLFTVSYVGVYLTYIAIPVIVISGLIMKLSTPKEDIQETISSTNEETGKVTTPLLSETNSILHSCNNPLEVYNEKNIHIISTLETLNHALDELNNEKNSYERDFFIDNLRSIENIDRINDRIKIIKNNINEENRKSVNFLLGETNTALEIINNSMLGYNENKKLIKSIISVLKDKITDLNLEKDNWDMDSLLNRGNSNEAIMLENIHRVDTEILKIEDKIKLFNSISVDLLLSKTNSILDKCND